jgi:GT2 family glycosyltransferase
MPREKSARVPTISAFGPRAQHFTAHWSGFDAVVADVAHVPRAYLEAVERRVRGEAFYGMILFEERRWHTTLDYASAVIGQVAGADEIEAHLELLAQGSLALNGQPVSTLWKNGSVEQAIGEFYALSTAVLTRSTAEWERTKKFALRPRPYEVVMVEPVLPAFERRPAAVPSVVVWAPNNIALYTAWYAFALREFWGTVTVVCADVSNVPPVDRVRFVAAGDGEVPDVLAQAHAVVCFDPNDPGAAVAFARRGFGVAAPVSSGAHEFVRDIVTFDLDRPRNVQVAASSAIARSAGVRTVPAAPPPLPVPVAVNQRGALPLVTGAIFTYNRPDDLENALATMAAQTYPNLDILVMNDGGVNVDHLVARYANARVVNLPENRGMHLSLAAAREHIRGSYVQLIADDDTLYPDHITRMMNAMLATGASAAHGNTLIRYQRRLESGAILTVGYNATVFNDTATPTESLIATPIAGHALLLRMDLFDAIGWFRTDCDLADQEFQLRAAQATVFAYVDHMTAEWRVRGGTHNFAARADSLAAQRQVYADIHPRPDRPLVEARRTATLEAIAARPKGWIFTPTLQMDDGPPA